MVEWQFRFTYSYYFGTYYIDPKIVGQQLASRARIIHQHHHNDFCNNEINTNQWEAKERRKTRGRTIRYSLWARRDTTCFLLNLRRKHVLNKETRRKDSARSVLRRSCKRIASSVLVSRKIEKTLCKEKELVRGKETQSKGRCWLRKEYT